MFVPIADESLGLRICHSAGDAGEDCLDHRGMPGLMIGGILPAKQRGNRVRSRFGRTDAKRMKAALADRSLDCRCAVALPAEKLNPEHAPLLSLGMKQE